MSFWKIALGVGCGILLAALAAFAACTFIVGGVATNVASEMEKADQAKSKALSMIKFEDVQGGIDGNFMRLKGKIRNTGTEAVEYVKVGVEWLADDETVLDTDWTYAVGIGESLEPGSAKSFEIMTTADKRMTKFRYHVMQE